MGDHEHHGHHHTTEAPDNHDTLPQPGDGIGVSHPHHGGDHSGHHRGHHGGHHGGQFQNDLHWKKGVHKILKLMTAKYICAILV